MVGGEIVLINRKIFREFHTDKEASQWAIDYFGSWIKGIEDDKGNIGKLIYNYSGGMNILYNDFLRGYNRIEKEQIPEYSRNISIMAKEISKFSLEENIIVYRYTHKVLFRKLFESSKPKIGKTFTEKGFMSTTLVADLLRQFAKEHKYNCILKLYLPKGTKGAYISGGKIKLHEQEFVLPPNATFKLIRKNFSFKYFMCIYECELVSQ